MSIQDLLPVAEIQGDSAKDTALLRRMAEEAVSYVQSFAWCPPVKQTLFGDGVGGVVAVFMVLFSERIAGADDDRLWVVVGDLPSAYLVVESGETPHDALEKYCALMNDWVAAVNGDRPMTDVFPVPVEATTDNANALRNRLEFIRKEILGRPAEREREI